MDFIYKLFNFDYKFLTYYNLSRSNYNALCQNKFIFSITIVLCLSNIFKYIIIKLNQIIKNYYYILTGKKIIFFLIFIIFISNDRYVQTFLCIFICLDFLVQMYYSNTKKSDKYLTPHLNIYYPIPFSIFSVTIRITGIFLSLILGFGFIY